MRVLFKNEAAFHSNGHVNHHSCRALGAQQQHSLWVGGWHPENERVIWTSAWPCGTVSTILRKMHLKETLLSVCPNFRLFKAEDKESRAKLQSFSNRTGSTTFQSSRSDTLWMLGLLMLHWKKWTNNTAKKSRYYTTALLHVGLRETYRRCGEIRAFRHMRETLHCCNDSCCQPGTTYLGQSRRQHRMVLTSRIIKDVRRLREFLRILS